MMRFDKVKFPKGKVGDNLKIVMSGLDRCHSMDILLKEFTKKASLLGGQEYRTCNCNTSRRKTLLPMQNVKQAMKFKVSQWITMQ